MLHAGAAACAWASGALGVSSVVAQAPAESERTESGALKRPWPDGTPTPPLALPGYQRPPFDLASARGKVVVVNFWASWCPPCRDEMPSLDLLAQRHADEGLVVLAVNFRETDAAIDRFMASLPTFLPIVRDADGAAARAWGARVFPTTVIVGRDGRARFSVIGGLDWLGDTARDWIAPVLAERT